MSDDDCDHEWEPLLLFDTDDPEFVRGFEVGMIYAAVERGMTAPGDELTFTVHANNAEMMIRVAESFAFGFRAREAGDDHVEVTFVNEGK